MTGNEFIAETERMQFEYWPDELLLAWEPA